MVFLESLKRWRIYIWIEEIEFDENNFELRKIASSEFSAATQKLVQIEI